MDKYPHYTNSLLAASDNDDLYDGLEGLEELFSRRTLAIVDPEAHLLCPLETLGYLGTRV